MCVVLKPGAQLTPEELFDFFRTNLPYYAVPRYVEFLDELPVNAMGRVQNINCANPGTRQRPSTCRRSAWSWSEAPAEELGAVRGQSRSRLRERDVAVLACDNWVSRWRPFDAELRLQR